MIRKNDFKRLNDQIAKEVENALKEAKEKSSDNNFLLLLCNAQYVKHMKEIGDNPYVVDYSPDIRHDSYRLNVLMEYLNSHYSFNAENTVDSHLSITFELMIYTHMWESKPFLRKLFRFTELTNGLPYSWDKKVPDYKKHEFVNKIKQMFENANLEIAKIIESTYNSSLRNAFAHSEYNFGLDTNKIFLTNYKGKSHEIDKLSFDEWTERFCKTFLLGFYFQDFLNKERNSLKDNHPYSVKLKEKNGDNKKGELIFDKERNFFRARLTE